MSYTVSLSNKARKFLRDLTDAKLLARLEKEIDGLAANPRPPDSKELTASDGLHRVRVGDYRKVVAAGCFKE